MMHNVHAPIATPLPLGLDAAHTASPACDVPGEAAGTVWYTLVDFIRTVVEARASARISPSPDPRAPRRSKARTAPSPSTPGEGWGEGPSRSTNRPAHH